MMVYLFSMSFGGNVVKGYGYHLYNYYAPTASVTLVMKNTVKNLLIFCQLEVDFSSNV